MAGVRDTNLQTKIYFYFDRSYTVPMLDSVVRVLTCTPVEHAVSKTSFVTRY